MSVKVIFAANHLSILLKWALSDIIAFSYICKIMADVGSGKRSEPPFYINVVFSPKRETFTAFS